MYIFIHREIELNYYVVQQKLTQHYKSIIQYNVFLEREKGKGKKKDSAVGEAQGWESQLTQIGIQRLGVTD